MDSKDDLEDNGVHASSHCQGIKAVLLYDSSRKENQALYLNQFGRSILYMSYMFLSLGVLQMANQQAACPQNANGSYTNCGNEVYGMQPSSLLVFMAVIGGVSTSFFTPYAGAVLAFSDRRLEFGKFSALLLTLTNFVSVFLFKETWFIIMILQSLIANAAFEANRVVMFSYMSAPSDHDLQGVSSSGRIWETFGMLLFFMMVGGVQFGSGWDSIAVARFSQVFASAVGGTSLFLAYKRYMPVKAVKTLEKKPDGSDVNNYIASLKGLKVTMTTLGKTDPNIARLLLCTMFVEASKESFIHIAITYLSQQIEMTATQIIIFIILILVTNPIGTIMHIAVAQKVGHKRSYVGCLVYTLIVTPIMIGTVHSPQQTNLALSFSVLIGIRLEWFVPSSIGYFASLVPEKKVTELWGLNGFCCVILSWVPSILFAVLNEATGNMRIGWIGVIIFDLIGLGIGLTIPEKEKMDITSSHLDCSLYEEKGSGISHLDSSVDKEKGSLVNDEKSN